MRNLTIKYHKTPEYYMGVIQEHPGLSASADGFSELKDNLVELHNQHHPDQKIPENQPFTYRQVEKGDLGIRK